MPWSIKVQTMYVITIDQPTAVRADDVGGVSDSGHVRYFNHYQRSPSGLISYV